MYDALVGELSYAYLIVGELPSEISRLRKYSACEMHELNLEGHTGVRELIQRIMDKVFKDRFQE